MWHVRCLGARATHSCILKMIFTSPGHPMSNIICVQLRSIESTAKGSIIHWALALSITSWRLKRRLLAKVDRWHGGLPARFQKAMFCRSQNFFWSTAMGSWALQRINTVLLHSHFNLRKLDGATLQGPTWQIAVGLQLQPHTLLDTRDVILQKAAKLIGIERKEYWSLVYVSVNKIIEVALKENAVFISRSFQSQLLFWQCWHVC